MDLDLIRQNSSYNGYFFNVEGKRKVVLEIFMYGLIKLKERTQDNTIPLDTIHNQVGLVFCMSDYETIVMVKQVAEIYRQYMSYNDVAGIRQIQFTKDLDWKKVLDDYYEKSI